ncbi:MAG: 2-amino-4-hydroxy-6-hydroxymethyldihydropteridine diphosphokinase [Anaeromyxobacter sp.]|nr:2-amino-4-hydroxy-6-hydroxymethyldihydropteridine diphosphokinase [Anaeromyxobacter sp.]MBL0275477.1 2-amino-4-hydroxy-6-hydroxymethyldihydropteridine diphosphokinase [Anaeromyxobacter sp.]
MRAYVGVGTNLGDRWAHLALAARALRATPRVALTRASRVHDTAPLGPPQPRYLNAVLELETTLPPVALLAELQRIEREALRRPAVRWGPRSLDLDLLVCGPAILALPGLTLPHPGLASRRFVLGPLCELAPGLLVPGDGRSVAELLAVAPPWDGVAVGRYPA